MLSMPSPPPPGRCETGLFKARVLLGADDWRAHQLQGQGNTVKKRYLVRDSGRVRFVASSSDGQFRVILMTLKCFIFYNLWNGCYATLTNCRLSIPHSLSSSVNAGSIRSWETYYCNKKIYPIHITDHISESCITPSQGLIHILAKCFIMAIASAHVQPSPCMQRP